MIKTLRITTIIAALLAVGLLAFPVVYGYRGDEEIEKFLKSAGAIERFNKAKGAKSKTGNQVSPLVKQAALYALIINPPRTTAIKRPTAKLPPVTPKEITKIEPPRVVTTKFKLIGTSYYASRPELSLAYIDEPGKGMYWVRQGEKVAHLDIDEVRDGSLIVKDREKTFTLVPERTPKKSLIKGETTSRTTLPGATTSITSTVTVAAGAEQSAESVKKTTATTTVVTAPAGRRTLPSAGKADAALADFINELKVQQTGTGEGYSEAEKAALKEAIADFEAMRVPANEASRLDRLGKELKQVQPIPPRPGSSKVGRSKGPQPPPRPPQLPSRPTTRRLPTRRPRTPTRTPSTPPPPK
ncbi:MAG: hypothetical protein GWN67_15440 [Phycisphaerae bacterium]|nr:hypothetical protein [Phycisphaerae bacterium]NIR67401.1 hypothetical protein [candidate division Zixibacteria bacterium]NIP53516.1 hypothetical protein [Phycisphaerae bacterium]NIS52474.1 hypothetical protein [Phycisphaerae bacterium]NIU09993.1 hypothetical protein [Phycisphaerae bacterium]